MAELKKKVAMSNTTCRAWLRCSVLLLCGLLAGGATAASAPPGVAAASGASHAVRRPASSSRNPACARKPKPARSRQRPRVAPPPQPAIPALSRDPYAGAIVIEAVTGQVLFEDNADAIGYPASVIKLMDLLLVQEAIQRGALALEDAVPVRADAARMGGSQVYLKEGEVFTVDEMLFALIVQSANDAAVALAQHVAGTKVAFVEQMNRRAAELGMKATRFHSVHGLPPGRGQEFDVSTARDLALLARAVVQQPLTFRYTATREHPFRNGSFIVRTHNHLLGSLAGCDGLKTGYILAGGYSIAATAQRDGVRLVAVVLGSKERKVRDLKTRELLNLGFQKAKELGLPPAASLQGTAASPAAGSGSRVAPAAGAAAGDPAPATGAATAGGTKGTGTGTGSAGDPALGMGAADAPAPGTEGMPAGPTGPSLPSLSSPAAWGVGGLVLGLLLGYFFFGRSAKRRLLQ